MKRSAALLLSALAVLSAIVCIVLPIVAFSKAPGGVHGSGSAEDLWTEEAKQISGPVLMIVAVGWVLVRLIGRGLPSWFWLAPIFGAAAITTSAAGEYGHDVSHLLFAQCSSLYSEVIGLSIWGAALAMLAVFLILRGRDLSNRHYRKNLFMRQESGES